MRERVWGRESVGERESGGRERRWGRECVCERECGGEKVGESVCERESVCVR